MSTLHRWFRSGEYSLLAHIDSPPALRGERGVLMVPPFGWEDVCAYRPLRFLGRMLAEQGIPTLRFDLPGTGDSSGDAHASELVAAWIRSIGDAADELRSVTGVREIAVLGVRSGAMLALSAAAREANVQDLILWGASASGRSFVRELRAFSKMARAEYSNGAPSPPQPVPGLEAGGFLISPETQKALEEIDLTTLPDMPGRRVLLLSRDEIPADDKLIAALRASGCRVELQNGSGYSAMMAIPEDALPPMEAGRNIIDFLTRDSRREEHAPPRASIPLLRMNDGAVSEAIFDIEHRGGSMFGVLSKPRQRSEPSDWCVVFLNPGAVRHTGPNRMWVEAARRLANRGVTSLRLDLQGIGESDGETNRNVESLYQDSLVDQVEVAMQSLRSKLGARRFALVGLCSGAFWSFHAVVRNPSVRAGILLNPRLFFWDPEVDRRRLLRRTARLLTERTDWARIARGYISMESVKRVSRTVLDRFRADRADSGSRHQIWPEGIAESWAALDRNRSRLTLIFTEGEPLLREMEEEGHLSARTTPRVRCIRMTNCGHTFRPLWAQQAAHQLIDQELDAILSEPAEAEAEAPRNINLFSAERSVQSSG